FEARYNVFQASAACCKPGTTSSKLRQRRNWLICGRTSFLPAVHGVAEAVPSQICVAEGGSAAGENKKRLPKRSRDCSTSTSPPPPALAPMKNPPVAPITRPSERATKPEARPTSAARVGESERVFRRDSSKKRRSP